MIIELVSISAMHGNKEGLGKALISLIGPMRVEPGCLGCRLYESLPENDQFEVVARWQSEQDLISHLQSDLYKRLLLLMELSSAPPVVEFFTVLAFRGLELVEGARKPSS